MATGRTVWGGMAAARLLQGSRFPSGQPRRYLNFKLDEKTAHCSLDLFKKETGVIYRMIGIDPTKAAKNPERFTDWAVVLADTPLSSGRHYWEVTVKRSQEFRIGVAETNMSREECIGADNCSWVYAYLQKKWYSMASSEMIPVDFFGKPDRVGFLLDCEAKTLSLIEIEKAAVVSTIMTEFRAPLVPAFALWDGELITHPCKDILQGI
ncbi:SPRY domain-containing protein 4 isoform X1 [Leucoraja erinacea]|uniref:SPRY domain-containing protein 4 isoform X1 n=1 Tax=Leucoraja erinaceus TaxID=7782 RepID=UPI002455A571|nr:SPRY domain-containing protein 4 isoform X1 [Leucoraja erinacea]